MQRVHAVNRPLVAGVTADCLIYELQYEESVLFFVLKLTPFAECSPMTGMCCVLFTAKCYTCAFQPDTSNFRKRALPYI